ncbi:MAG: hypothetical protein VB095_02820, partial [Anaerovorax sp.]|nr:hypothetical protein [Anaerovorax sp.]
YGNQKLFRLGDKESLNPQGKLMSMGLAGEGYFYATFKEESECPYRIMVFDSKGKLIFRSADVAQQIVVDQGRLCYVEQSGKICLTKLTL